MDKFGNIEHCIQPIISFIKKYIPISFIEKDKQTYPYFVLPFHAIPNIYVVLHYLPPPKKNSYIPFLPNISPRNSVVD